MEDEVKDEPNDQPALIGVSIEELLLTGRSQCVVSTDIGDQVGTLLQQVKVDLRELSKVNVEKERLEQHVQDLIDASGQECACGYDKPDDICLGHKPMVDKLRAEKAELVEALEVFLANAGVSDMSPYARRDLAKARALLSKHKGGE